MSQGGRVWGDRPPLPTTPRRKTATRSLTPTGPRGPKHIEEGSRSMQTLTGIPRPGGGGGPATPDNPSPTDPFNPTSPCVR